MPIQARWTFWSQSGDETLICLETFWRNGRWHLLFPHSVDPQNKIEVRPLAIFTPDRFKNGAVWTGLRLADAVVSSVSAHW